jgi:hypothetical protein
MKLDPKIKEHFNVLIQFGETVMSTRREGFRGLPDFVNSASAEQWYVSTASFVRLIMGEDSEHSFGIPGVARFGVGTDGRTRTTVGKGLFRWEQQGGRAKGCGCSGCLGTLLMGSLLLAVIGAFLPKSPSAVPAADGAGPSAIATSSGPPATKPQIPLFLQPQQAAQLPLELGLTDTAPGRSAWREGPHGWYALATVTTHTGKLAKEGDIDNTITCLHESTSPGHIDRVTWTAHVFNPDGQAATLPRFREVCLQYTARLGCPLPEGLFQKVSPEKGQQLETDQAHFSIEKLSFTQGFGWRYCITSKF